MTDTHITDAPAPRRKRTRRRYNWPRIKAEYVEGIEDAAGRIRWPSMAEVAQRSGSQPSTLRDRAAADHWTEDRAAFQRRIETQRQTERATELASLGADLDVNALRIARNGMAVAAARIQELGMTATARTESLRQSNGRVTATTPPPADSEELGVLSRAATAWYDMGRKALGDTPTVRVEVDTHIEAELSVAEDDSRAVRILTILKEVGAIPDDGNDALDVAGGPARPLTAGADPQDEPVHPTDVDDDREQEHQATDVPPARSA